MHLNKLALALSLAFLALPMTAMAQDSEAAAEEPASNYSWNFSLTSDYVFRGITQTDFQPAVQGGMDYAFGDSGWYVGAWASNVDFVDSDGPDLEIDTYIGWSQDLSDDWNLDLHAVRYTYVGENDAYGNIDYNEYFAKLSYKGQYDFTVAYADDYANGNYSSLYYQVAGSWDVGNDYAVNAGIGHSNFSDHVGSYTDWNLGISRQFGMINVGLNYYDTTGGYVSGFGKTSDSVVLTFGFGG